MSATPGRTGVQVPLSRDQERTWFVDQLSSCSSDYLIPLRLHFAGPLDRDALRRALDALVARHEVLRTGVLAGDARPVGVVRPAGLFRLRETEAADAGALDAALAAEAATPMDLAAELPVRALLIRHGDREHTLVLTVHHVAADDWSCALIYDELAADYAAFTAGRPSPVPPPAEPYRAVAARLDALADEAGPAGLAHWRSVLADLTAFEVPVDRPRPAVRAGRGAVRTAFVLPPKVADPLTALGRSVGATPAMLLTAAVQTVLYRYTGRTDVTTGTTYARRDDPATERLLGLLINMLPLRGRPAPDLTFRQFVERFRDVSLDAFEHAEVPFDRLVEESAPERDPSRTPLFQILVNFRTGRRRLPELPDLTVTELPMPYHGAKYDLCVSFEQGAAGLWCGVNWDVDLYDDATVERLGNWLERLLRHVAERPDTLLDDIPLLSAPEEEALRALVLRPAVDTPRHTLHELVALKAAEQPDAVALVDADGATTSYAALEGAANAVARRLIDHGVGPDVPVGLLIDRSVPMVVGLLGVLKAGGAYLPIETATPAARIATLLSDAGAPVCLTGDREGDHARTVAGAGAVPLAVDPRERAAPPSVSVRPDHLCAVYYTSGSTGRPKGVACTHRGWVNRMAWMQRRHGLRPGETVLHKTTLPFDDAAVEILWPLITGGTVALLPPGLHRDPRALVDAAVRHRAVHVQFVPSVLDLFLEELTPDDTAALRRNLRSVLSSGEALRPALVERFRDAFGDAVSLDNTWGATEVSIDSTFHVCGPRDTRGGGAVSLGRPMDNNEVLVLDHRFSPLPPGVPGELCIAGTGLARGYLGDPAKTAGAFVPHPYRPGERVYRTGDRGRMLPDGTFAYLERMDRQVKVRGVRVELGEVEAALREHPAVPDAAVVTRRAASGDLRLAAYVALDGAAASVRDLREHLSARLPGYALPATLTVLPALPRSASGKLSPALLPEPDPADHGTEDHVAPRDETERIIAGIWADVLSLPRVGVLDDFFSFGGHSLIATRAVNRMRQAFDVQLPLSVIFERPTVAGTAEYLHDLILAEIEAMSDDEAHRLLTDASPAARLTDASPATRLTDASPATSPADNERGTTR